jgi:ECF transporter S component (folate family)
MLFSPRAMAICAMLAAMSIVCGKYLAIPLGNVMRFSFENLPIVMAGVFFGPIVGGIVGAVADLVGCFLVGYAVNPVITLGAALIGVISGTVSAYAFPKKEGWRGTWRIFIPVMLSHIICSMGIKTLGMMMYFGTPAEIFYVRVPLYIVIGILESYIIMLLFRNKTFIGELNRIINKKNNR